ncbi:MAG: type II toxin-antitoxin system HicB family antitoxin [Magnetococcus sp. DMHC-1]|nr:hypothetical protein [Magnetococcales bacterium]MBF0155020.1 hypothetical protein [Magnetococcales bacterium]
MEIRHYPAILYRRRILIRTEIPCRWVRLNLSMAETLVLQVDHAAKALGMNRSGYLAEAARQMLSRST